MRESIIKYLQFGSLFCGIEHTAIQGKNRVISTLVKKKKKELTIEKIAEVDSLEEVTKTIPSKQPVFLIINNDQVLTKRIDNFQQNKSKAIDNAFPNIDLDDFYYEIIEQKEISFVSLCRKKYVEDLIEEYRLQKIQVLDFSLGNTKVFDLLNYISFSQITTSNAVVHIENSSITDFEKTYPEPNNYDINGLDVSNQALLSFSGALSFIIENGERETNFSNRSKILRNDYFQLRFFALFLKFSLVFILGLLLFNFFFFSHYYNEVNSLRQNLKSNQALKEEIRKMDQDLLRSKKIVRNILRGNSSKSSFYVNEIVQTLPKSILLNELNFQPLSKRVKKGDPIIIIPNLISVSGKSVNNKLFSEWLMDLNSLDWVKKVKIKSYSDVTISRSDFEIIIVLKNE